MASSFTCTANPLVNVVSAANLTRDCLHSIFSALANNHPNLDVWLQSYYEEKRGIDSLGTYDYVKIYLAEYRAL